MEENSDAEWEDDPEDSDSEDLPRFTYYEVLEIPVTATTSEIEFSFSCLSESVNYLSEDAVGHESRYRQLPNAYAILRDDDLRNRYDHWLRHHFPIECPSETDHTKFLIEQVYCSDAPTRQKGGQHTQNVPIKAQQVTHIQIHSKPISDQPPSEGTPADSTSQSERRQGSGDGCLVLLFACIILLLNVAALKAIKSDYQDEIEIGLQVERAKAQFATGDLFSALQATDDGITQIETSHNFTFFLQKRQIFLEELKLLKIKIESKLLAPVINVSPAAYRDSFLLDQTIESPIENLPPNIRNEDEKNSSDVHVN